MRAHDRQCAGAVEESKERQEAYRDGVRKGVSPADAGVDVEKEEHSSIVGGSAGLYNHSGNQSGGSSENWT